jgi:hypothetical protein
VCSDKQPPPRDSGWSRPQDICTALGWEPQDGLGLAFQQFTNLACASETQESLKENESPNHLSLWTSIRPVRKVARMEIGKQMLGKCNFLPLFFSPLSPQLRTDPAGQGSVWSTLYSQCPNCSRPSLATHLRGSSFRGQCLAV